MVLGAPGSSPFLSTGAHRSVGFRRSMVPVPNWSLIGMAVILLNFADPFDRFTL